MQTVIISVGQPGYDDDPANGEGAQRVTIENGTVWTAKPIIEAMLRTTAAVQGDVPLGELAAAIATATAWNGDEPLEIDLRGHMHRAEIRDAVIA